MRVLAHPTRLRLLGLLRERSPQTAAMLGDVVDEAPGTVSYHLGKLGSIDLIEEAPSPTGDRRERWWQASHRTTTWESADMLDDPEKLAASAQLERVVALGYGQQYARYVDTIPSLPREWVAAATSSDDVLRLTVEELGRLRADLEGLHERWRDVSDRHTDDDDAAQVSLVYQVYRRPR